MLIFTFHTLCLYNVLDLGYSSLVPSQQHQHPWELVRNMDWEAQFRVYRVRSAGG